ncbi:MAG: type II toxin-antitoxin system VapC family toxin [Bosea sp.]|nr:type II toxin-antitoxin system VapC family toxin [Bosea sp. (in: a-proteobacteria)]
MTAASAALVLDTSVVLAWCFADEVTAETERIAEQVRDEGAIVPALWHWEVANALLQAERRRRISAADASSNLRFLSGLPILTDDADRERTWQTTLALARSERLSVYDASYLELAIRLGAPLASLDADLVAAARRSGIRALP